MYVRGSLFLLVFDPQPFLVRYFYVLPFTTFFAVLPLSMAPSFSSLAPAATAPPEGDAKRKRGRPKGSNSNRASNTKFSLDEGVDALSDEASRSNRPYDWDGKSYPKPKRSNGPHIDGLEKHYAVLGPLVRLTPNGYPDPYYLRDLLMKLHEVYKIFKTDDSVEGQMSLQVRALVAADKWRIMLKHLLMLLKGKQQVHSPNVI